MDEKNSLSLCWGWIAKNEEGKFLNENYQWVGVDRNNAFIHLSDPKELPRFHDKVMDELFCIYSAMMINGKPYFGVKILKGENGKFVSP